MLPRVHTFEKLDDIGGFIECYYNRRPFLNRLK